MQPIHYINSDLLTIEKVRAIIHEGYRLQLSDESIQNIQHCRQYLDQKLSNSEALFYGINTGFGSLCNIKISEEEIETLQSNLVKSHSSGMGDLVPPVVVKMILLLKIQSLSYGHSAIQLATIKRLIDFFNEDILPIIYQQGSLGASGDLAPLAHMSLPLIGLGEVWYKGNRMDTDTALTKLDWKPLALKSKEGLALLNGTQFSTAYGVWAMIESKRIAKLANICAAMSIDAFDCKLSPFDERLHKIRPHKGQIETAAAIRELLKESELAQQEKVHVQDPYAFRCVPQVHGASTDAILFAENAFVIEINAVTDNPIIFPDDDTILSGGNFHAQPIALPLDFLAIALAELGSISERRTYQLIGGKRTLPAFLTPNAGLHSGFMISQYTAASIVSQNKQLCTPASVDSIVSCNGQEDHVSMAANAATKLYSVAANVEKLLAIEFMNAAQALEFRRPLKSSPVIEKMHAQYRLFVPKLEEDRVLSIDLEKTVDFLRKVSVY